MDSKLWNIAHRGASGHAPENTLAAFDLAAEMGAGFIETDLRLTRDSQIVAIHDATVNRTTNGRGRVRRMTLGRISALDAGARFSRRRRSSSMERVPTLDEILQLALRKGIGCYLELKSGPRSALVKKLAEALKTLSRLPTLVVISFHPGSLKKFHELTPEIVTGFLTEKPGPRAVKRALAVGARQFLPRADRTTPELVALAQAERLDVVVWTVNERAQMRRLIASGVQGIITNYPDRLAALN